jgi:hypothetical protein
MLWNLGILKSFCLRLIIGAESCMRGGIHRVINQPIVACHDIHVFAVVRTKFSWVPLSEPSFYRRFLLDELSSFFAQR